MCATNQRRSRCRRKTSARHGETGPTPPLVPNPTRKARLFRVQILRRFRQNLFVFLTDRAVSPTNNGSEQALRPCVIFRKVTNGFRSRWGADLYADVRSALETARRRGVGILHALRLTLNGQPLPNAA